MIRFGELSDVDRERQAEAFVRWFDRAGHTDWEGRFDWWAMTKDFHPGDEHAIRQKVQEIMVAGGAAVLVDPLDWLNIGREHGAA